MARRDYIETVRAYNTELRTIPGRWIAAFLYPDAKPMETFAATAGLGPAAGGEVLEPMVRRRRSDGRPASLRASRASRSAFFFAGPALLWRRPFRPSRAGSSTRRACSRPTERAALDAKLKAHEDKTTDQIVVATVRSLEGSRDRGLRQPPVPTLAARPGARRTTARSSSSRRTSARCGSRSATGSKARSPTRSRR